MTALMSVETASVVQNSRRSDRRSPAPKNSLMMTEAPMPMPMMKNIAMFMSGLAMPTAASAEAPAYLPTMMLSTVL